MKDDFVGDPKPTQYNVCKTFPIPYDILIMIYQHLPCKDIIHFSQISRMFCLTLVNNNLWHILIKRDYHHALEARYFDVNVVSNKFYDMYKILYNPDSGHNPIYTSYKLNSICKIQALQLDHTIISKFNFDEDHDKFYSTDDQKKNFYGFRINLLEKFTELIVINTTIYVNSYLFGALFFDNIKTLTHLYIRFAHLIDIPTEICQLVNLKVLDLSHNDLNKLSDSIHELISLTTFCVSFNDLYNIPGAVYNMSNLKSLDVSNNSLTCLHKSFSGLKSLTYLDISHNKFLTFPDIICEVITLKTINISVNDISYLPPRICELTNLEVIHISCNKFLTFPVIICEITTLKTINISQNEITYVPSRICKLTNLNVLDVSFNRLSSVPEFMYNLIGKVVIILIGNRIVLDHKDSRIFPPKLISHQNV